MPETKIYTVTWSIKLHATSMLSAARMAHGTIIDPNNTSLYFRVADEKGNEEVFDLDEKSNLIGLLEDVLLEFGHKEQILLSRSRICEWLEFAKRR